MTETMDNRTKNKFKVHREIWLIVIVLAAALVCSLIWQLTHRAPAAWAVVTVDGEEQARYLLSEDRTQVIEGYDGGTNTLVIRAGEAWVTDASCPDHICEDQGKVSRNGQTITCLPNRVMIEIQGGGERTIDGVAE